MVSERSDGGQKKQRQSHRYGQTTHAHVFFVLTFGIFTRFCVGLLCNCHEFEVTLFRHTYGPAGPALGSAE